MGYQALLFCSDEKLSRIVSQVFVELDFVVDPVSEPFAAVKKLMAQHYDAIVVDCAYDQNAALIFKSARNSSSNQVSLAIGLVEGQTGVAKAYRIGANLVLTKPINVDQAKGTLRVARGLIRKTMETAHPASEGAAATTVSAEAATEPSVGDPPAQSANRIVEVISSPSRHGQSPEFEAPTSPSVIASSEGIEAAQLGARPARDWSTLAGNAPALVSIAKAAREEITITEVAAPIIAAVVSASPGSAGAAAAPARTKEIQETEAVVPAEKEAVAEDREESARTAAIARGKASLSTVTETASEGPSFTIVGDRGGSPGSRKILIAAMGVVALICAGYFGWMKSGAPPQAAIAQLVTRTTQFVANVTHRPPVVSAPAPVAASAPSSLVIEGPTPQIAVAPAFSVPDNASTPRTSSSSTLHSQPGAGPPATTRITIRPELEAQDFAPAPLVVRPAARPAKAQVQTDDSAAPLPQSLSVPASGDNGLSDVLSSASANVAKPTLTRMKISQGVSQGLVIKRVQPKYPPSALATHTEGAVQIEATISKEGFVIDPKVLSGDRMLAAAALTAVRQWRYKPYYLDGEPVEIQTQITVSFKAR